MASDPSHSVAYYFKNGKRHEIRARDLNNADVWRIAKSEQLFDGSGTPLFAIQADTLHFRGEPQASDRSTDRGETNPIHDARVQHILDVLNSRSAWSIEASTYAHGNRFCNPICNLMTAYQWGSEVYRIISSEATVRHDVFGQAKDIIDMSKSMPWIAVEVINSHYPEDKTFDGIQSTSKNMPLLVLFDLTERPDHFLKIDGGSGVISTKLYMYNGNVYDGTSTDQKIKSSAELKTYVTSVLNDLDKKDQWKKKQIAKSKKGH